MSVFSRLERMVSRSVDRLNAERFRLLPMKASADPNGRRAADPARTIVMGSGVFDVNPAEFGISMGARAVRNEVNDIRALNVGRRPVLSVSRSCFPQTPRAGDLVEMLDRPDLPTFSATSIQPDGESRLEIHLAQLGT